MSEDKPTVFVTRLCNRTLVNKIPWEKTSTESVFQATIGDYIVRFLHQADGNRYIIELYNSDNELVDKFHDEEFDGPPESYEEGSGPMFALMHRAFAVARRKAMGTEDALDSILDALRDEPEVPF